MASTLARSETLARFDFHDDDDDDSDDDEGGASESFIDRYCVALSKNVDTKLERLYLSGPDVLVDLDVYDEMWDLDVISGLDAAIAAEIRLFVGLNVQRKTCDPLFAAIDDATTDMARRQCLVKAFSAVGCPLTFEYIRSNQYNLITLIQKLGRSSDTVPRSKRQRLR